MVATQNKQGNNNNNNKNDDEEESYDFPDDPNNDKCQVLNENGEDVTSKFYDYHHRLVNCTGELVCHAFTTTNCPSILCKENQACYEAKFFNVTSNVECLGKKPCRHAEIHALALAAVSTTTSDNGNNENDEDKEGEEEGSAGGEVAEEGHGGGPAFLERSREEPVGCRQLLQWDVRGLQGAQEPRGETSWSPKLE